MRCRLVQDWDAREVGQCDCQRCNNIVRLRVCQAVAGFVVVERVYWLWLCCLQIVDPAWLSGLILASSFGILDDGGCCLRLTFWYVATVDDIKILHYLKDPKLWELWYIPDCGSCRIPIMNRRSTIGWCFFSERFSRLSELFVTSRCRLSLTPRVHVPI